MALAQKCSKAGYGSKPRFVKGGPPPCYKALSRELCFKPLSRGKKGATLPQSGILCSLVGQALSASLLAKTNFILLYCKPCRAVPARGLLQALTFRAAASSSKSLLVHLAGPLALPSAVWSALEIIPRT